MAGRSSAGTVRTWTLSEETVIYITLPNGEARTRAINYCPMCGERLGRGKD